MAISGSVSYGSLEIKVSPDLLLSAARDVLSKTNNMKQSFESMRTYIDKTSSYWKGEAGNFHRELYSKQQDTIDSIISLLNERVSELEQMAANYTSGESMASSTAEQLNSNIIEF